jgi:RNA polymerase sigma-70 factor (ECF subfamily)
MIPAVAPLSEFEGVYGELFNRIYAYVRAQLRSDADAEDVTAIVFMNAYRAWPRYEPQAETPAAWLFRIARNAVLDFHRGSGRRQRLLQVVGRERSVDEDPAATAERHLEQERLLAFVERLPDRQRETVRLRMAELSFAEIGVLLECTDDAAKMLYHRAIRALREMLDE